LTVRHGAAALIAKLCKLLFLQGDDTQPSPNRRNSILSASFNKDPDADKRPYVAIETLRQK
jgi:hypothetical protein